MTDDAMQLDVQSLLRELNAAETEAKKTLTHVKRMRTLFRACQPILKRHPNYTLGQCLAELGDSRR